jgi:L-lactate dehydrogenase complex protein LldF
MNHCPVYSRLGGHAYGTVYAGPIGSVLEPQLHGVDALGELADASSLCGACGEVCPVRIPIPRLLARLRCEGVRTMVGSQVLGQGSRRRVRNNLVWRLWTWAYASPTAYRAVTGVMTSLRFLVPKRLGAWSLTRRMPAVAPKSLHRLAREEGFESD